MKKMASVILSICMIVAFAGCNPQSDVSDKKTSAANELTVWCWDPNFNIFAMKEAEKIYQKENPNFKLNIIEMPWNDVQTQLITAGTTNNMDQLPDIFLCENKAFKKNLINFPDIFVDLSSSEIKFEEFSSAASAVSTVDGKHFGVPFDSGTAVMALRTDILQQAGYTIDDFTDITWDQFIEQGKVVLDKTGKPLLSFEAGGANMILMLAKSAGESFFDTQGNPQLNSSPVIKKAFETYQQLVLSGVLLETQSWDEYVGTFIKGSVAGAFNGCWILGSVQVAEDQSGNWGITNIPSLDGLDTATNYTENGGSSWVISSNCKNPDLAIDFLNKTFSGSSEFYDTILGSTGAIANWLPAGKSYSYSVPQEFFGNEAIYETILAYSSKVPLSNDGVYIYEAVDAVAVAMTNILNGASIDSELEEAQKTIEFQMN